MTGSEHRNARRRRSRLPAACRRARAALVAEAAGDLARPGWCDDHLAECSECADYAARLLAAGAAVRAEGPGVPQEIRAAVPAVAIWRRAHGALGLALAGVVVLLAAVVVATRPTTHPGPSGSEDRPQPHVAAVDASARSAERALDSDPAGAKQATRTPQPQKGEASISPRPPDEPRAPREAATSAHRSGKPRPRHVRSGRPRPRPTPAREEPLPAQRADEEQLSAPEPEGTEVAPQPPMPEREPRIVLLWQTADGRVIAREEVRGDGGVVLGVPGRIVLGSVEQTAGGTLTEVLEAETPVVVAYWQDQVICAEAQGGG